MGGGDDGGVCEGGDGGAGGAEGERGFLEGRLLVIWDWLNYGIDNKYLRNFIEFLDALFQTIVLLGIGLVGRRRLRHSIQCADN